MKTRTQSNALVKVTRMIHVSHRDVELYYRDAKQLTIVEGTTQVQLGLIAKGVLDRDLWWD